MTDQSLELNYKKMGEGKDLIILHGLFGSLDNWMSLGKKWAEDYRVWLVDQRNHGRSPHSDEFSYQLMAADLKAFIDQHGLNQPMILGHSMGGKTAMELGVNEAELIERLIVVDIAPVSYDVHHYSIIEALQAVDPEILKSRQEAGDILSKFIDEAGIRQFLLKNLERKKNGGYQWKFNLKTLAEEIVPISSWEISEGSFNGKTLFVKGENSDYILPHHASRMEAKFPHYSLEEVSNAGHWVHAEQTEAFYNLVSDFMKD